MTDTEQPQSHEPPAGDSFLRFLVRLVNQSGATIGITVSVGGAIISGHLASGRRYFEKFADDFTGALKEEYGTVGSEEDAGWIDEINTQLRGLGEIYPEPYVDVEEEEDSDIELHYLHIKNARYFSPGQEPMPTTQGTWWRGRISEVSGFSLGALNVERESSPF